MINPVLQCLAAAILFAAGVPVSKLLLGAMGPFRLAGILYLGAAIAALPAAWRSGASRIPQGDTVRIAIAAAAGGGVAPVLLLIALRIAPAASVSLWLNLETVATAVLAWAFFQEHLDRNSWVGVFAVAAAGVILAAPGRAGGIEAAALVALACVCWGLDNNLTATIGGLTPSQMTAIKGLAGGAVNLTLSLALEHASVRISAAAGAIVVGGLSYGLSLVLYIGSAQQLGAARSQILFASAPFAGCVFAWNFLGEPILANQVIGAIAMAGGLSLMFSRHEHEHLHDATTHTHRHSHDDAHHAHSHGNLQVVQSHTHVHVHTRMGHTHRHLPDLHHRHRH